MSKARDEYYSNEGIFIPVRAQNYVNELEQQLKDSEEYNEIISVDNVKLQQQNAELDIKNKEFLRYLSAFLYGDYDRKDLQELYDRISGKHTTEVKI